MTRNFLSLPILFSLACLVAGWMGSDAFAQPLLNQFDSKPQLDSVFPAREPLPRGALTRLGALAFRHCDSLTAVAFSPDGKMIATLGRDHAACLWDRATGKMLYRIHEPEIDHHALAFSPDSRRLVLGCSKPARTEGCYLQVHDTATGQEIHRLVGHEQPICAISFLPGETSFLSISCDQVIRWDLKQGRAEEQRYHDWPTGIVALAPEKPLLAFASNKREDPFLRVLNAVTGKPLFTIDGEVKEVKDPKNKGKTITKIAKPEQAVVALAFSPDGKYLASGSPFEAVRLWDMTTGRMVKTLDDPQGGIALAFSPDGKVLATGTINGMVRLWDVASGKEVRKFSGFKAWVNALAFSPDGQTIALAGAESRMLYLWDVPTGRDLRPRPGHRGAVQAISFSAQGRSLVSASWNRDEAGQSICVWDSATGEPLRQFGKFPSRVLSFAFTADGPKLAVAEDRRLLPELIDVASGQGHEIFQLPEEITKPEGREAEFRMMCLAFSPGDRLLAGGSSEGKVFIWEAETGRCLCWWKGHQAMITSLAFSPDGNKLMTTAEDRTARLWDARTGKELLQFAQTEDTFGGVCLSSEGNLAAALSAWCEGKIYLWDLQTGKELRRIPLAFNKITHLAFSPNGKMLAACDVLGTVTLYEAATGKPRAHFAGHLGEITSLAFSPDGLKLATGSADTTVLVWDVTDGGGQHRRLETVLPGFSLQKLWQDLGHENAAVAYQAMWKLAAHPAQAGPFLRSRLKPADPPTPKQIQEWITDLDHPSYSKRVLATNRLQELGNQAEPFLQTALQKKTSNEVYQRLKLLLNRLEKAEYSAREIQIERGLETLGWIGTKNSSPGLHAELKSK